MIDESGALLSAIRETQLDHGQQLSVIEGKVDKLDHGQQKLRRDVEALQDDMGEVKGRLSRVEVKLDRMNEKLGRLDGIEERLDRLNGIEEKLERLLNK